MKNLFLFLLIFAFSPAAHSLILIEGTVGISVGDVDLDDSTTARTLNHGGPTYGAEANLRLALTFFGLTAGVVGNYAAIHFESERENPDNNGVNDSGADDYDNSGRRTMAGLLLGFKFPGIGIRVQGEYYTDVQVRFTYAEPAGHNPFNQGDKMVGDGWGLGLNIGGFPFTAGLMYRQFKFDKFHLTGERASLPNGSFSEYKSRELALHFGIGIDLL